MEDSDSLRNGSDCEELLHYQHEREKLIYDFREEGERRKHWIPEHPDSGIIQWYVIPHVNV